MHGITVSSVSLFSVELHVSFLVDCLRCLADEHGPDSNVMLSSVSSYCG